jgi:hypothetical protein
MKTQIKPTDFHCDGSFEHEGYEVEIKCPHDECSGPPWENSDGHGPVSGWESRNKGAGERVLNSDRGSHRFYDFAEATKIAKRDGWGVCPDKQAALERGLGRKPTRKEVIAAAVESDFEFLHGWCNDRWHYINVCVTVSKDGREVGTDCLGGVEDLGTYWRDCAADMANTLIEHHELLTNNEGLAEISGETDLTLAELNI